MRAGFSFNWPSCYFIRELPTGLTYSQRFFCFHCAVSFFTDPSGCWSFTRLMYTLQNLEIVQLFSQTLIPNLLLEWCSTICTITYLLGPSASSLIVEMLFSIQQKYVTSLRLEIIILHWYPGITIMLPRTQFIHLQYLHSMRLNNLTFCKTTEFIFSFYQVGVQTSQMQMMPTNTKMFSWESFDEDISSLDDSSIITTTASGLLEQLNVTRDTSDYLWYITR